APVIGVALHDPDFVLDPPLALEGSGARDVDDAPKVIVVVLQRFLAEDDVPAAGKARHDEVRRTRLRQPELDGVLVAHDDLVHRGEQDRARNGDAGRRLDDAVVGCLDVVGGKLGAIVELHVLAQEEGIGLAVFGDLPAVGEIGNNGLATIARIAANEVVEHAALAAEAVDGARLVHVEMRGARGDAVAQYTTAFGVGFRRFQLKVGTVEFHRQVGEGEVGAQASGGCQGGGSALETGFNDLTASPMRALRALAGHVVSSTSFTFWYVW